MKFYCSHLLVLCGSASAFMAPAKNAVNTKLNSSPQPSYFGSQTQQAAPGAPGAPLSTSGPSDLAPGAMLTDADIQFAGHVANMGPDQRIQGGALRTWSFDNAERLVVKMSSDDRTLQNDVIQNEGRHMKVLLELCEGPDNTPLRMEVVSGKGKLRPFKAVIETPKRYGSLFLRNIGDLEFPITAAVNAAADLGPGAANAGPIVNLADDVYDMRAPEMLQGGGSVISFPLDPQVKSAKVQLKTDGRPLNAKIELIQGPNTIRYSIDLYNEDGNLRQFYTVITTPNAGNVIRIVNTAPVEYPLTVAVEPFEIDDGMVEAVVAGEKPLFKIGGI